LASTNIIESPNAGIREKTGRVTRWRDGQMVLRWTASALVTLEKRMRRIMGHQQLRILAAKLQEQNQEQGVAKKLKSAQDSTGSGGAESVTSVDICEQAAFGNNEQ
jgi:putative transposase